MYSNPGLSGTQFRVHQVWALGLIVHRWVWDTGMAGVLVADELELGKTFTSVGAAMICKLLTEKVMMGLPLSIVWGNILEGCVNISKMDF